MKTSRKLMITGTMTLLTLAVLLAPAISAQKSKLGILPPASELHTLVFPPIPGEAGIRNEAFSRFPGVDRSEMMTFLEQQLPEEMHSYKILAMRQRQDAVEQLTNLIREALNLMNAKKTTPAFYERLIKQKTLKYEARKLSVATRKAKGDEREKLLVQLKKTLTESFKIRQDLMKLDVNNMAVELDQLRAFLVKRSDNQDAIISRRISELTDEADYLQW